MPQSRLQAMTRLCALAAVFDDAGDYSAADCCYEWAVRAGQGSLMSDQMVAAILWGEWP